MEQPEMITTTVELDDYHLDFIEKNNIDLSKFVNEYIKDLLSGSPLSNLKLEAIKLKKTIEDSKERLAQVEKEIEVLKKDMYR
ncbi:MAG TPA: hypothetical protein DF296_15090 [Candidatus Margulisbacteria bacterium]|nr:hypothetical protein [Candidatus Margulisiibacteriota bacterium]